MRKTDFCNSVLWESQQEPNLWFPLKYKTLISYLEVYWKTTINIQSTVEHNYNYHLFSTSIAAATIYEGNLTTVAHFWKA